MKAQFLPRLILALCTFPKVQENASLIVGHKSLAWLEGWIVKGAPKPNIASWINFLKEVRAEFPAVTVAYGGRGESAQLGEAVKSQTNY